MPRQNRSPSSSIGCRDAYLVASAWTDDVTVCGGGGQLTDNQRCLRRCGDDRTNSNAIVHGLLPPVVNASEQRPPATERSNRKDRHNAVRRDAAISDDSSVRSLRRGKGGLLRADLLGALRGSGSGCSLAAVAQARP